MQETNFDLYLEEELRGPKFAERFKQAVHEAIIAKEAWLKTARARRKPIPPPRYRPAIYALG